MSDITPETVARMLDGLWEDYTVAATGYTDHDTQNDLYDIDGMNEAARAIFDQAKALSARLAEVEAMVAAAVMEAAARAGSVVWSGGIPYDEADNALLDASVAVEEAIRALITPDAMAALEAYRDREVAKALEGAAEWALDNHDCDAWAIADAIKAMIPQVKL